MDHGDERGVPIPTAGCGAARHASIIIARSCARQQDLEGIGDDEFGPGHWHQVRREIGRRIGRVRTVDGVVYDPK